MGTNGIYGFKYNKLYYIFFKCNDSYPRGLGRTIVQEIQSMNAEQFEELKEKIKAIDITDKYTNSYCGYTSLLHSVSNPHDYVFVVRTTEPNTLYFSENYMYILDIDKNVFVVIWNGDKDTHKVIFDINNIPAQWEQLIETYDD